MEKRQNNDRAQTDRMTELAHAVVSSASLEAECAAEATDPTIDPPATDTDTEATDAETTDSMCVNAESEEVVAAAVAEPEGLAVAEAIAETEAVAAIDVEVSLASDVSLSASNSNAEVAVAVAESAVADDYEELGPQERLGRSLRNERVKLEISLDEIARTTKIPKTSLLHIEAGRFDSLPGDVFARGFLRSYARCIGMDGDEVVRRYAQCGLSPAPVSSVLADAVLGDRRKPTVRRVRGAVSTRGKTQDETSADSESNVVASTVEEESDGKSVRKVLRDAFDLSVQVRSGIARHVPRAARAAATDKEKVSTELNADSAVDCKSSRPKRSRTFVPPNFDYESDMTHRGPLTLGVIVLVIVATLTMSYLLRRPGTSTDGFTMIEPTSNVPTLTASVADGQSHVAEHV